ncbi:UNVERIFIED_CONTAM: hypothetical protein Sangu_1725900 [Sesamum angustifolium]|uniref:Uncharacterized protein n=1 Tax=Sesamum angustifolium TaxID=2727405 RepID=A0AAW2M4M9_9LAMI
MSLLSGCGLEHLEKSLQDIQYHIARTPSNEQQGIPFSEEILTDELPLNWKEPNLPKYDRTTNPQEHLSYFENVALFHHYITGVLQNGDFFKSLTKKPPPNFYNLLALAEKYINFEEAREYKNEVLDEKRKKQDDKDLVHHNAFLEKALTLGKHPLNE